jgi:hypothetical protein
MGSSKRREKRDELRGTTKILSQKGLKGFWWDYHEHIKKIR